MGQVVKQGILGQEIDTEHLLVFFLSHFLLLPCFCLFASLLCFFGFLLMKTNSNTLKFESCFSSILSVYFGFLSCFFFQIRF